MKLANGLVALVLAFGQRSDPYAAMPVRGHGHTNVWVCFGLVGWGIHIAQVGLWSIERTEAFIGFIIGNTR